MIAFELFIIIVSIVYIWEHSGFIFDVSKALYSKLNPDKVYMGQPMMKPFGCYSCIIFWTTFIYSFFTFTFIPSIGIGVISSLFGMFMNKMIGKLIHLINKL